MIYSCRPEICISNARNPTEISTSKNFESHTSTLHSVSFGIDAGIEMVDYLVKAIRG